MNPLALRELDPGLDPSVVARIDERLADLRRDHGVAIPWAIESGSRAWGFPSPDSDYDCRFIFVRSLDDYLDPWPPRDVLETPLDALLDVSGWDLVKAVRLAENGNATVTEWLRSPIIYGGDATFREEMLALCEAVADRARIGRHYLHVGRDHWVRSGAATGADVALKRVFYALRPAAALHWMRQHDSTTAPMNLHQLLAEAPPSEEVAEVIAAMVAAKAVTRELGSGVVEPAVRSWVQDEFDAAVAAYEGQPASLVDTRQVAARAFRDLVRHWAPAA